MQRVSYDLVTAILLIGVSVIALVDTRGLSEMSYTFPRSVGFLLLGLSIFYLVISLIKPHKDKMFADVNKKRVHIFSLAMAVYAGLIVVIGFLLASILFISVSTWYFQKDVEDKTEKQKWINAFMSGVGVSLLFFALFRYVFLIPLPLGMLFGG